MKQIIQYIFICFMLVLTGMTALAGSKCYIINNDSDPSVQYLINGETVDQISYDSLFNTLQLDSTQIVTYQTDLGEVTECPAKDHQGNNYQFIIEYFTGSTHYNLWYLPE